MARHLSNNYGDRAWTVCSLAESTGESWPLHGKRLASSYPCPLLFGPPYFRLLTSPSSLVIDAEIRYAVRHEYALTAVDVLARRTRLSFLNARAALDALPYVVDIMADELGWSYKERKNQIAKGVQFLGSMGLSPAFVTSALIPEPEPRGIIEHIEKTLWKASTGMVHAFGFGNIESREKAYGRSKFESGEVAALRNAFINNARAQQDGTVTTGELKLKTGDILEILKDATGYSEISKKELNYVLDEAGLKGHGEVDFDQFIEASFLAAQLCRVWLLTSGFSVIVKICGNLKEVALAPTPVKGKTRRSIPVEKSGGGV